MLLKGPQIIIFLIYLIDSGFKQLQSFEQFSKVRTWPWEMDPWFNSLPYLRFRVKVGLFQLVISC
jgi:hypothetical protein